ncbi:hypothetical protein BCR44DRAFT_1428780 [Catenaria anguillulae PL171]|uniref:Uncharacterized protein n=1 Tax=Catenaria anguillulae PL171 TaxID=765915 RepID=A0A1Y2H897_9FUNG|nr:hypothetical protein BCR44DRAFT_1456051 [Catenaria anguillulae PL171]ORZ29262.1 hypothetical protein BCR44DRAFT_1453078 [Catenaria anguillulae PL171]ORZ29263.1 hypothetical protein BCR44DRAFT_1453079 [Catenaria anguillulae PL171]ORZ38698.1 hypothetical protein BCR44DRAFT_1428780 [Catenaria anguillulae PL171]
MSWVRAPHWSALVQWLGSRAFTAVAGVRFPDAEVFLFVLLDALLWCSKYRVFTSKSLALDVSLSFFWPNECQKHAESPHLV